MVIFKGNDFLDWGHFSYGVSKNNRGLINKR